MEQSVKITNISATESANNVSVIAPYSPADMQKSGESKPDNQTNKVGELEVPAAMETHELLFRC